MRITTALFTVIGALSALSSANASPSDNGNVLSPGQHLSLLQRRTHGGSNAHHNLAMKAKRAATSPKTPSLKKRGNGYCKPKPKPQQSQAPPPPPASSSKNDDGDNKPSSTKTSSKPKPTPSDNGNKGGDDGGDDGGDNGNGNNGNNNNGGGGNSGHADAQLGSISGFKGTNSGIMSWFRTNAGQDSTNGMSWCETRYKDDWMCFAPSVGTMLKNFNYDRVTAAKHYCGREVRITYNGKSVNAFICDGFDDRWVRSAGSIDATTGLFRAVYGSFDGNKNTVGQGVQWEFTGGIVQQGTFQHNKYN